MVSTVLIANRGAIAPSESTVAAGGGKGRRRQRMNP